MKLYDFELAPNPRRVRIFLAEKGVEIPLVPVNIRQGEHLTDDFRRLNPQIQVPCLELDDGTIIAESMAICRYIEASHPQPPLFGTTPLQQGLIEMWNRRVEHEGWAGAVEALRNSEERFVDRALPGPRNYAQIPALVERGKARIAAFYQDLDAHLEGHEFVVGGDFSVADINAFVMVEFASARIDVKPHASQANLARWHRAMAARPSAGA